MMTSEPQPTGGFWPTPHGFGTDGHGNELSMAVRVAEGLSQSQTAQAMGVSQKMIEQHIAAAIRRLTERLRA